MNQISATELKRLKVAELLAKLPAEITADGEVIAVIDYPVNRKAAVAPATETKCPNCKLEYTVTPPDNQPFFFTMQHPKYTGGK